MNTAFYKKNISTVKYDGSTGMVWGCFPASGPGQLAIIDGPMNSALYQKILNDNVQQLACAQELHLGYTTGL